MALTSSHVDAIAAERFKLKLQGGEDEDEGHFEVGGAAPEVHETSSTFWPFSREAPAGQAQKVMHGGRSAEVTVPGSL